ncbi:MAG: DJ-1 family glyoxalase III [Bacilli bacterium]|nr:DJ-1 family glyoxalase III [Bacilli bacterium]MDY6363019.1 DJ-1 family glyoxalase III [Bacilli bacterium]
MKVLMLLADGFEDTEALTTRDVLTRAGIEVTTASITDRLEVQSSFGVHVLADALLKLIFDTTPYEAIILPGGGRGTRNLSESPLVPLYLQKFASQGKLLCAICAAPSILGKHGYLKNKKYTCFAGFNEGIAGDFTANEVEKSGNIITARSMQYSIPFALTIIEELLGKEAKEKVQIGLQGLDPK